MLGMFIVSPPGSRGFSMESHDNAAPPGAVEVGMKRRTAVGRLVCAASLKRDLDEQCLSADARLPQLRKPSALPNGR
jgi:hypothetical protein